MFIKLRSEKDAYQMAFVDRLNDGETISSSMITIDRASLSTWTVSTEFITAIPQITDVGKTVQFTLDSALSDSQVPGRYRIRCVVQTSEGRILQANQDLRLFE